MTRPLNFTFSYQDFLTVTQALDRVKSELAGSSVSSSHAIALICADYLATNAVEEGNEGAEVNMNFVIESIKKYESLAGVQVVIVDDSKEEVLYGEGYLKKILGE